MRKTAPISSLNKYGLGLRKRKYQHATARQLAQARIKTNLLLFKEQGKIVEKAGFTYYGKLNTTLGQQIKLIIEQANLKTKGSYDKKGHLTSVGRKVRGESSNARIKTLGDFMNRQMLRAKKMAKKQTIDNFLQRISYEMNNPRENTFAFNQVPDNHW